MMLCGIGPVCGGISRISFPDNVLPAISALVGTDAMVDPGEYLLTASDIYDFAVASEISPSCVYFLETISPFNGSYPSTI